MRRPRSLAAEKSARATGAPGCRGAILAPRPDEGMAHRTHVPAVDRTNRAPAALLTVGTRIACNPAALLQDERRGSGGLSFRPDGLMGAAFLHSSVVRRRTRVEKSMSPRSTARSHLLP